MSDRTRPTQELPALRGVEHEDGLMSLAGGALEYNGQWFFVVNGRVTHFNEETQEARGKLSIFAPSNLWRPFCSERCRQIDLGAWASESFRMPASPPLEDQDVDASAGPSEH